MFASHHLLSVEIEYDVWMTPIALPTHSPLPAPIPETARPHYPLKPSTLLPPQRSQPRTSIGHLSIFFSYVSFRICASHNLLPVELFMPAG